MEPTSITPTMQRALDHLAAAGISFEIICEDAEPQCPYWVGPLAA